MIRTAKIHQSRLEEFLRELKKIESEVHAKKGHFDIVGDCINCEGIRLEIVNAREPYYFLKIEGEEDKKEYIDKLSSRILKYETEKKSSTQ